MSKVYLGIGSNLGDRLLNVKKALKLLDNIVIGKVDRIASIFESKPYGLINQNNFLNTVIEYNTELSVIELFSKIKLIEKSIGREISERWGPREIDIDILLYDEILFSDEEITVPHKDLTNRDFVIKPLLELLGDFVLPGTNKLINEELLRGLENHIIGEIEIELLNLTTAN